MSRVMSSTDWAWDILDEHDHAVRRLHSVEYGATVEFNMHATIRGGGSVNIVDAGESVNWLTARLQPVHIDMETGVETPWGVFLPVIPEIAYTPTGRTWRGKLLDKTHILHMWKMSSSYTVTAGTVITGAVGDLLALAGQTRVAVTESARTLSGTMVWEPGTSVLRIVNDLLDAANYRALWVDRVGVFHVDPYVLPKDRPRVAVFEQGADATHVGAWTLAQDVTSIPNHVVCVGQPRGSEPPLVGEAENVSPLSAYSVPSRGRRISLLFENVEASDQATLTAIAERRLVEASTPACMLKGVRHQVQRMDLGDVVSFSSQGVQRLATVERQVVTTRPGALMESDLRAVVL